MSDSYKKKIIATFIIGVGILSAVWILTAKERSVDTRGIPWKVSKEKDYKTFDKLAHDVFNTFKKVPLIDSSSWTDNTNFRYGYTLKTPKSLKTSNLAYQWNTQSDFYFHSPNVDKPKSKYMLELVWRNETYYESSLKKCHQMMTLHVSGKDVVLCGNWGGWGEYKIIGKLLSKSTDQQNLYVEVNIPLRFSIDTPVVMEVDAESIAEIKTILSSIQTFPVRNLYRVEGFRDSTECGDARIVYVDAYGNKHIEATSTRKLLQVIGEKTDFLCGGLLKGLAFHELEDKLFLQEVYYEFGPSIGTIYEYNLKSKTLRRMYINDFLGWISLISLDGKSIVSISSEKVSSPITQYHKAQKIYLLNLITDTVVETVVDLNNDRETLIDYEYNTPLQWIDETTLEYSVFDLLPNINGVAGNAPLKRTETISL